MEEDSFVDKTPYGDKTFVNIIARQNPSATRHLTLACHYDSKMIPGIKFIGATDSAVPCAIMIDVAGLLSQSISRVRYFFVHVFLVKFLLRVLYNSFSCVSKTFESCQDICC